MNRNPSDRKDLSDNGLASNITFGRELIMDLYECDQAAISSEESIKRYAREICQVIDMKPYGEPMTPYFGESLEYTKGYSLVVSSVRELHRHVLAVGISFRQNHTE